MFGYVRPAADRLTQEQTDLFRSAYCGLCRTLGRRYGLPARMILNYDLAILLAGGSGFSCARHRCPVHPIRGCPCGEENPALDAAADLSVILTWWQLRDGVTDHGFFGGLKYRLAALLLRRSYRKAARLRPDFDRLVQGCLGELAALERENCPSIDRPADTFARLLDDFYQGREQADRVRQKGQDLMKAATAARDRVRRKLALQEKEYAAAQDREPLRLAGELITANLYRLERGMTHLTAENYYEEGCPQLDIRLDPLLTPQQNAARYFKQYAKAKTAERILTEQLEKGRQEFSYLESVVQELQQAELEQDFNDIRTELTEGGYLRGRGKKQPGFQRASRPREFRSTAGLRILVGRSNRQNDKLTCKDADRRDIWFHTQKIHGSHVILCTGGIEPDRRSIEEAASLAAYYSQGREGGKVPVDYTPVKFVKKPAGGKPGMVVYTTYQTIYAVPDEALARRLSVR